MKLLKFLFVFSFVLSFSEVFATAQIPDFLITEKDTIRIQCNPLERYFEKNPIKEGLITNMSTALWRGYIAYFKIIDNQLVVENIYKQEFGKDKNGKHSEKYISIYNDVFGKEKNFYCNFYSGVLICPYGKMIEYIHMGYSSIFENYRLIEINLGEVQKEKTLSDQDFMTLKVRHFEKFKETEEYKIKYDEFMKMTKEIDESADFLTEEDKKRKKKNKYLYEKEKEIELKKSTENFLFLFISDNIKTIDVK
jgi:hypothetical protein